VSAFFFFWLIAAALTAAWAVVERKSTHDRLDEREMLDCFRQFTAEVRRDLLVRVVERADPREHPIIPSQEQEDP
jgi:hypothetical protein